MIYQVTDIHKSADGVFTKGFTKVENVVGIANKSSVIVSQFQEKMKFVCNPEIWIKKGTNIFAGKMNH